MRVSCEFLPRRVLRRLTNKNSQSGFRVASEYDWNGALSSRRSAVSFQLVWFDSGGSCCVAGDVDVDDDGGAADAVTPTLGSAFLLK